MNRWLLILSFPLYLFSQTEIDLKTFDYSRADSIALHFPKKKYKTVSTVAELLTQDLNTEHEKFRVIFRWITDNIEYNRNAQNIADADKVVRKNKAVCQGFSNLLKEMCTVAGVPCEMITGYTKTEVADIGKNYKKTDHAWNCVKLYGKWYLVDVTWATSKFNVVTHKFHKEFDEHYYLTPPDKFILDHYPAPPTKQQLAVILEDPAYKGNPKYYYQFLEKPVKRKVFSSWPMYYTDFFHLQLSDLDPDKGSFSWKQSKPLRVELHAAKPLKDATVLYNADKVATFVELKQDGDTWFFDYSFPKSGKCVITVYFNGMGCVEYLVKVK